MAGKRMFFKKKMAALLMSCVSFAMFATLSCAESIVIDHTCTDLSKIPTYWLEQAKQLAFHYAHTSHGSQIKSGMLNLESQDVEYSVVIRTSGSEGLPPVEDPLAFRMYAGNPPETYITPNDYWDGEAGKNRTRTVADTGNYGFSMWSWCGQVSSSLESYIQSYLDTMNLFDNEYLDMRFIYMTGHLDGTNSTGNLHLRNEQIRAYCRANDKVLFDFADIERYDPDGNDYLDQGANDNCDYNGGNWADQWCVAHPDSDLCASCSCAHSKALNCNQKARAFWWMLARLAGWIPNLTEPEPDIKANGSDGPISIYTTDTLSVGIELDPVDYSGDPMDWWVLAKTPFGWYYYHLSSGWVPGKNVTHQGYLFNLNYREVMNRTLPEGFYRFYFGVDGNMNGEINSSPLYYDHVDVTVDPE